VKKTTALAGLLLVLLLSKGGFAVDTQVWRVSRSSEFVKGKLDGVFLTARNEALLAPEVRTIAGIDELYVWCLACDSKGNVYAGTGDQGIVYKITRDGKASEFYRAGEPHVTALAVDGEDNVYAGTCPRGTICKITPAGKGSVFCKTGEAYVWALLFDARRNVLYAATGNEGKILSIARNGTAKVLFDSPQVNVLCLALDKEGNLYAGTDPNGIIYKVTPAGEARVLFDASEKEVRCMAMSNDGTLYAGTAAAKGLPAGAQPPGAAPPPPAEPSGGGGIQAGPDKTAVISVTVRPMPAPGGPPAPAIAAQPQTNCLYAISPDGAARKTLTLNATLVLSIAVVSDRLYIGTGNRGRLYRSRLGHERECELLPVGENSQVLAILPTADGMILGTGSGGRVLKMPALSRRRGTLISEVKDCGLLSKWGNISWVAQVPSRCRVTLATRTGNSAKPDATWSDWSREYARGDGEKITSPPARFIQFRATLSTDEPRFSPVLREVAIAYLPRNERPVVKSLTVDGAAPPQQGSKNASKSGGGKSGKQSAAKTKHKAVRTITWSASDPNKDQLVADLMYKGTAEKEWKLLKADIKSSSKHQWDTMTVPDGEYLVKVVVSDKPSNPPDRALTAERVSLPFLIDNTRPVVLDLRSSAKNDGRHVIEGRAVDQLSNIRSISYSIDAGPWTWIYPLDEIYDSREEKFRFETGVLKKGEHTVVIKVEDRPLNIGCAKLVIK